MIPEAARHSHNPQVVAHCPGGQTATACLRECPYITQHHNHYHYGCQHVGVGRPLYSAWIRHGTFSDPGTNASSTSMCFRAKGSPPDPPCIWSRKSSTKHLESDNMTTGSYVINKGEWSPRPSTTRQWLIPRSFMARTIHGSGGNSELADSLSCNHPDPTQSGVLRSE